MFHPDSQLLKIMTWLSQMVEIQLYWMIGILRGGIIFGFFPSTIAMIVVMREIAQKGETQLIRKFFFRTLKKEFKQANTIGLIMSLVTVILVINFRLSSALEQSYGNYFFWIAYGVLILWCLTCLYLLPMYAGFELSLKQLFSQSIIIIFLCPIETLLLLFTTLLFFWSVGYIMILAVLVSCGIYTYLVVRITTHSFNKIKEIATVQ